MTSGERPAQAERMRAMWVARARTEAEMSGGAPVVGVTNARKRLVTGEREKDDFYRTPPSATQALLEREKFPPRVWEPACGDGAMSRVIEAAGHEVVSTDLVDRGYGESRRDFLFEQSLLAPAIVTNPPFKLSDQFALHAIELGAQKIALFQRTAFLEGKARHIALWSKFPPARVWVFSWRVTLWRGDQESKDRGGVMSFAWFVWEVGYRGAPSLGWV